jgi:methenyltetrahydrofolate cyclohydrolase
MGPPERAAAGRAGPAAYLEMPVGEFLAALSAADPEPGGGSAAALTVALGAGLCAMTAGLSARRLTAGAAGADRGAAGLVAEAQLLRDRAASLAQADAEVYGRVIAALRGGGQSVDAALSAAAAVPLEVANIGAQVAALAATIAGRGNPNVRGDAITAAQLAAAGARAAAQLVRINLASAAADGRPGRAQQFAAEAARDAAAATTHR